jgi:hypothetical protein
VSTFALGPRPSGRAPPTGQAKQPRCSACARAPWPPRRRTPSSAILSSEPIGLVELGSCRGEGCAVWPCGCGPVSLKLRALCCSATSGVSRGSRTSWSLLAASKPGDGIRADTKDRVLDRVLPPKRASRASAPLHALVRCQGPTLHSNHFTLHAVMGLFAPYGKDARRRGHAPGQYPCPLRWESPGRRHRCGFGPAAAEDHAHLFRQQQSTDMERPVKATVCLVDGMVCGQRPGRVGARDRCWVAVGGL